MADATTAVTRRQDQELGLLRGGPGARHPLLPQGSGVPRACPLGMAHRCTHVQLHFIASVPPECLFLYKLHLAVWASWPRPLQSGHCGHFDHATLSCRTGQRCSRCLARHRSSSATCGDRSTPTAAAHMPLTTRAAPAGSGSVTSRPSWPAPCSPSPGRRPMPVPRKCNQRRRSYAQATGGRAPMIAAMPPASSASPCSTLTAARAVRQGDRSPCRGGAGARGGPACRLFCSRHCRCRSGTCQTVRCAGARALRQ